MEYLSLDEIRDKSNEVRQALDDLLATKVVVGKGNARQWRFFKDCIKLLFDPRFASEFENIQPIQSAQFKFEVEDKLNKFYLHPGKPIEFVFSLVHKSKLSDFGITDETGYPMLAGYSALIRDLLIDCDNNSINNKANIRLYLERVITEANDAEFSAYQALPAIKTDELAKWFCEDSPAIKEIINLLNHHQKRRWIISNPFNPSTRRLLKIKITDIKVDEAMASTTEYWYLRWWDEKEGSYAYPYRETNNQKYILKPEGQEWKVYMNLRPQPKSSTPHRWNRRQNKISNQ
jgi:hypothetical protein